MSKRIRKYNLPDSYWDTPEPISLSELKQQAGGKFVNIRKLFAYAEQQGKRVSDLTDEEKRMFLE